MSDENQPSAWKWVVIGGCVVAVTPVVLGTLVVGKLLTLDAPHVHVPVSDRWKLTKRLLYQLLVANRRRLPDFLPPQIATMPKDHKFITGWDAAKLIKDGATVCCTGFAGHMRNFLMFYTISDLYKKTKHPNNLRWITISAQGGRGKFPGTVEQLALKGLLREYVASHHETAYKMLEAAQRREIELSTLPMGAMLIGYEAQGKGEWEYESTTGLGTFLDPRIGRGSAVTPDTENKYIEVADDGKKLKYKLPKLDIVFVTASYCDREGNLYFTDASCINDQWPTTVACKANNGIVVAIVAGITQKSEQAIAIPTSMVDHIVVHPVNEQVIFFPISDPCRDLLVPGTGTNPNHITNERAAFGRHTWINSALKVTAVRSKADHAVANVAAKLFTENVKRGSVINIGVGLGEELGCTLFKKGLHHEVIQTTEGGAWGGVPIPGAWFGGSIAPARRESGAWMFGQYKEKLDCCILGFLEVDSEGNVNVSNRGEKTRQYIGPGGFADISDCAKTLFFMGAWMAPPGKVQLMKDGKMKIVKQGPVKFVEKVREITFSGMRAVLRGKKVFYVTHVGVFTLTPGDGLVLIAVFPGIDIDKDIMAHVKAKVTVRKDPPPDVIPTVTTIGGKGFELAFHD